MLVLVPCTWSSAVPCHHKVFPIISTRLVANWGCNLKVCQRVTLQLLHAFGLISVISPNFGRFCFIVLYCCWFGPHTGAEWKCVIVEIPVCCVFLRIVPIFCCLISFFIIPYVHTLPLSPQHERQHILRVSMTWILVQPWIFTCLLFLFIPLFTLLEWWYNPAFSSFHHFLRIVTT